VCCSSGSVLHCVAVHQYDAVCHSVSHCVALCCSACCNVLLWYFWRINLMREITRSYVWHDAFICVPWLIHMCCNIDSSKSRAVVWTVCEIDIDIDSPPSRYRIIVNTTLLRAVVLTVSAISTHNQYNRDCVRYRLTVNIADCVWSAPDIDSQSIQTDCVRHHQLLYLKLCHF